MGMSEALQKSEITASLAKIDKLLRRRSDLEKLLSQVRQASQRLANARATVEEYRTLAIILQQALREAQNRHLESQQFEAKIRETPFASLVDILPKTRTELYAFLTLLVAILTFLITLRASGTPTITPSQVEEIIERILEHNEHEPPPSSPATPPAAPDQPDCK